MNFVTERNSGPALLEGVKSGCCRASVMFLRRSPEEIPVGWCLDCGRVVGVERGLLLEEARSMIGEKIRSLEPISVKKVKLLRFFGRD